MGRRLHAKPTLGPAQPSEVRDSTSAEGAGPLRRRPAPCLWLWDYRPGMVVSSSSVCPVASPTTSNHMAHGISKQTGQRSWPHQNDTVAAAKIFPKPAGRLAMTSQQFDNRLYLSTSSTSSSQP
uniref:Uncharacterized protein n=1 Tax=Eutreptiella gymnastica TaxID=73025 RepID=A0A6U8CCG9_9EUGL|mmetsp:Transcript_24315/g.43919  ORF Transcript_24315/g.43919 Transcript_24315/m.43919 type:complete len:124 (+) Transcript_24315:250-621(+)